MEEQATGEQACEEQNAPARLALRRAGDDAAEDAADPGDATAPEEERRRTDPDERAADQRCKDV